MHEDFEAELRESVARFNEGTVPPPVASVRAQGERFHRRKLVGTAGLAMALVAGLGITAVAATNNAGKPAAVPTTTSTAPTTPTAPTAPTTTPTTAPGPMPGSTTGPATPQSQQTSVTPASPALGTTSSSGPGPVDLAVHPPAAYAAGTLNPVTFTAENHGSAVSGVTATLTLTRPKSEVASTTGPWPLDVLERHDPVTGTWSKVAVAFLNNGVDPHGEDVRVAHYTFDLPSGTTTEELRVDPEGSFFTLGVELTAGSSSLAQAQTDKTPVSFPAMTASGPKVLAPGATGEFDVSLTNGTPMSYSSIAFRVSDVVTFSPVSSASQVQVYDGTAWRTVSFDQGWAVVATRPLAPGATTTVRLRVTLATTASPGAAGDLGVVAYVPGEFNAFDTSLGLAPGGSTRTDTTFALK